MSIARQNHRAPDTRPAPAPRPTARWARTLLPAILIILWLLAFSVGGRAFSLASAVSVSDPAEHLPASAEATLVHELAPRFRSSDALPATLVFASDTELDRAQFLGIEAVLDKVQGLDTVVPAPVSPARPSGDDHAAVGFVPLETTNDDGTAVKTRTSVEDLRTFLAENPVPGVSVYVAGPAGMSTVLSFGTALGVSALVFNSVFGFPGADTSVPLYGFVFLVALGVDYNIFLMTRVREEAAKHGTREGILRGLRATGGVITSAGLVLAAAFAALGVLPVLFLAQLGFILAFGVLLDTIVVRSLLVPALAYDLGDRIWWPRARGFARHRG